MAMSLDPNTLMKRWMIMYMNLNILRSFDPDVQEQLDDMKMKLTECNELLMKFFDMVNADPERAVD